MGQKNLPLAEGDLEWADSVTGKPKAELLRVLRSRFHNRLYENRNLVYTVINGKACEAGRWRLDGRRKSDREKKSG